MQASARTGAVYVLLEVNGVWKLINRSDEKFTARGRFNFVVIDGTIRVSAALGPERQVGHSYFMVPDLDADTLAVVWDHHVGPLLSEYFAGQPGRAAAYELDRLLNGRKRRAAAVEPG